MTERIFSRKVVRHLKAGEYALAMPVMALCNAGFLSAASHLMNKGITQIWDPSRAVADLHQSVPVSCEGMADGQAIAGFVEQLEIVRFHQQGEDNCYQVMIEKGYVRPDELLLGVDSRMSSYRGLGLDSRELARQKCPIC